MNPDFPFPPPPPSAFPTWKLPDVLELLALARDTGASPGQLHEAIVTLVRENPGTEPAQYLLCLRLGAMTALAEKRRAEDAIARGQSAE
jgi:hypothetical protein